jgi:hypothetical protein
MKAHCIEFTGDRATVVLTPGWLRRLFGVREVAVDLEWLGTKNAKDWYAQGTGRSVLELTHGDLIRDALDFREVGTERRGAHAKPRLSLVGDEAVMP